MKPGTVSTLLLAMAGLLLAAAPGLAQDVTLYELNENMMLIASGQGEARVATSALAGSARMGTPICPRDLFPPDTSPDARCAINAIGSNDVSLQTGRGSVWGSFTTVVQDTNPVDGPELVVRRGKFAGHIDLSPAFQNLFVGTMRGFVHQASPAPFKGGPTRSGNFIGVFRLPFLASFVATEDGQTLRQLLCPASPEPNPHLGGLDIAYVGTTPDGQLTGQCLDARPNELALGTPTVRLDLYFQAPPWAER
jgi:hypothetical protein